MTDKTTGIRNHLPRSFSFRKRKSYPTAFALMLFIISDFAILSEPYMYFDKRREPLPTKIACVVFKSMCRSRSEFIILSVNSYDCCDINFLILSSNTVGLFCKTASISLSAISIE